MPAKRTFLLVALLLTTCAFLTSCSHRLHETNIRVLTPMAFNSTLVVRQKTGNDVHEQKFELPVAVEVPLTLKPEFDTTKTLHVFLLCQYLAVSKQSMTITEVSNMWDVKGDKDIMFIRFSGQLFSKLSTEEENNATKDYEPIVSHVSIPGGHRIEILEVDQVVNDLETEAKKE